MKEKILTFIIGFLVGAIIATGAFIIYEKTNAKNEGTQVNTQQNFGPNGGGMPPMMQNGGNFKEGNPPDMPQDAQSTDSTKTQEELQQNTNSNNTNTQKGQKSGMKGNFNGQNNGNAPTKQNNNKSTDATSSQL